MRNQQPPTPQETEEAVQVGSKYEPGSFLWLALEYGFKAAERGWNLEQTKIEFTKLMKSQ